MASKLFQKVLKVLGSTDYQPVRERRGQRLGHNGEEMLDSTPNALHMPKADTLEELIRRFHAPDVQRFLDQNGLETAAEADDFGPDDDDNPDQYSFESHFDHLQAVAAEVEARQQKLNEEQAKLKAEFAEFIASKKAKASTGSFIPEEPAPQPRSAPQHAGEGDGGQGAA